MKLQSFNSGLSGKRLGAWACKVGFGVASFGFELCLERGRGEDPRFGPVVREIQRAAWLHDDFVSL